MTADLRELSGLTLDELTRFVTEELGEQGYRARQIFRWIHQRGATSFDQMTNLSKPLRQRWSRIWNRDRPMGRSSIASGPRTIGESRRSTCLRKIAEPCASPLRPVAPWGAHSA